MQEPQGISLKHYFQSVATRLDISTHPDLESLKARFDQLAHLNS